MLLDRDNSVCLPPGVLSVSDAGVGLGVVFRDVSFVAGSDRSPEIVWSALKDALAAVAGVLSGVGEFRPFTGTFSCCVDSILSFEDNVCDRGPIA